MQKGTVLRCLRFEQEMENCPLYHYLLQIMNLLA